MGGRGSGGQRVGAGRKSKDSRAHFLGGNAGRRTKVTSAKDVALAEVSAPAVDAPVDLSSAELAIWNDLAPHATAAKTLVPQTIGAFRDLCEAIVLKREMIAQVKLDGMTYLKVSVDGAGVEHNEIKAHPLISQHRGMMQRVEAGRARFKLSPIGKEMIEIEKPKDEWDEFDSAPLRAVK